MAVVAGGRESRTRYRVLERFVPPKARITLRQAQGERIGVAADGERMNSPLMVSLSNHRGDLVEHLTLVELYLDTGRTHQVRVHLAYLGHPLVGDVLYGKRSPLLNRHFLHAHHLAFHHPVSGELLDFQSDLPEDLARVIERFRSTQATAVNAH